MKSYISFLLLFVFFLTTSCTEKYEFPNLGVQTTIVITGLITNEPPPYYVKVVENVSNLSTLVTNQRKINDAQITITDNNGNVDELQSFYSVPLDSALYVDRYYDWVKDSIITVVTDGYVYFINMPDGNGGNVRFYISNPNKKDPYFEDMREGMYFTTSTKGQPGHTYSLKVEYAGREYTATDYMCYGTVIDSISAEPVGKYIYDKPDDTDGYFVPCLYFAEPQDEVNFYMFQYSSGYDFGHDKNELKDTRVVEESRCKNLYKYDFVNYNGDWGLSVISDRFLSPYVYQYKMSDGDSSTKWYNGTDIGFYHLQTGVMVNMFCITEPVYRYYYALSRQYYEDGGSFSPSPASPPTNIKGGAQGCFSAASVSQYSLDLKNK